MSLDATGPAGKSAALCDPAGARSPGAPRPVAAVRSRWIGHRDLPALLAGSLIAVGVCWPFFGGGRLLLLDWVLGPRTPVVPSGFYGLSGGLTAGLPFGLVMGAFEHVAGAAATWVPIALFFPLAAVAASHLAGRSVWARLGAAVLYSVNPFVFQRLFAGQIALLLGYALLPFAVGSMLRAVDARGVARLAPVLWMAVLTGISPHFAWVTGVVLFVVVVVHRRRVATLAWGCVVGAIFLASLAYVFVPHEATSLPVTVGPRSLATFATSGDPRFGLFANVAGLYGFWRLGPGPVLPKSAVAGWPFLLVAILVVVALGALTALRSPRVERASVLWSKPNRAATPTPNTGPRPLDQRLLARVVVLSGAIGYFLALGAQGPTGAVFTWAYFHVPFFAIMREPEKFSCLLALGYALCFGWGIERLASGVAEHRELLARAGATLLVVALPLGYTPTIFDGLAGQIAPSRLPAGWQQAAGVMGAGEGKVLFLPWDLYLGFSFTAHRVVANPAPSYFRRDVISGTDAEVGQIYSDATSPRSSYIQLLLGEAGHAGPFGELVAPLGVEYVALAKTVDWRSYLWLGHEADLRPVLDNASIEVWRNLAYGGLADHSGRTVRRLSPVSYAIGPGAPQLMQIAISYQKGWFFDGRAALASPTGVLFVNVGTGGGVLSFAPWGLARLGYLASLVLLGLLGAVLAAERLGARRTSRPGNP